MMPEEGAGVRAGDDVAAGDGAGAAAGVEGHPCSGRSSVLYQKRLH